MMWRFQIVSVLAAALVTPSFAPCFGLPADPLSLAADYYFSRYDYAQSFALWTETFRRQPDNLPALFRLSELRLMYEGRPAVTKGIVAFLDSQGAIDLPRESRRVVREKLNSLQGVFLTDEGQTTFLQGLARARRDDCLTALPFLSQATVLEKGNIRVLHEKANCERKTAAYDRYYATLKQAYEIDPFDAEVVDNLADCYLYFQEYKNALDLLRAESDSPRTKKQRTVQAVALAETGAATPALIQFQSLLEDKTGSGAAPIVFFNLGKSYAGRPTLRTEATTLLQHFLSLVPPAKEGATEWDPFRTRDKVAEAERLLASLKETVQDSR